MTMFGWMSGGGTHGRLDRMNDKLDVLIEGQEKTNTSLEEINETLQEILKKIEIRYSNGAAQA